MNLNESIRNSYCFHLPDPVFQTAPERITTNLITAVINILAGPIAIIANVLILAAIINCSSLRSPSNVLIASLALSDVLVGLTAQPGYISYRLLENQHQRVPCFVMVLYSVAFYICFGVSCMTLTAVSFERFVAVRLPGRYITFFSPKRVAEYLMGIWTVNILLSALQWAKINQEFFQIL
ncbi:histamine H2 receptor-like [Stylophora pistillata]|uniref:histamine H2 receptor-like n=1 Tax=Stylophora pistillata TaxID=50429 RepID=UPI000C039366|nr:histamine H2 receptor-like [Stylophora pistillata]